MECGRTTSGTRRGDRVRGFHKLVDSKEDKKAINNLHPTIRFAGKLTRKQQEQEKMLRNYH